MASFADTRKKLLGTNKGNVKSNEEEEKVESSQSNLEKVRAKYGLSDRGSNNTSTQSNSTITTNPSSQGNLDRVRAKYGLNVNVDGNYISSFFTDAQNYLNNAQSEYEKLTWDTATSTYESRYKTNQDLRTRATIIRRWLDKNKGTIPEESYDSLYTALDDYFSASDTSLTYFKNRMDIVSQYESEDEYKQARYSEYVKQKEDELAYWEQKKAEVLEDPSIMAPFIGRGEIDENGNEVVHSQNFYDSDYDWHTTYNAIVAPYDEKITALRKELVEIDPENYGGWEFFKIPDVFKDGFDWYDIPAAIGGTVADIGVGLVKGVGGLAEGLVDLGGYAVAGLHDLAGADGAADSIKDFSKKNLVSDAFKGVDKFLDQASALGHTTDSIAEGLGQVFGIYATAGLGALGGLGATGQTVLTSATMGLSSMGSGMSEAYQYGATDGEAWTYGLIAGTADAASELLFGGLGKGANTLGLGKGLSSMDDMVAKKVSSMFSSQIMKNLTQYGIKASAEGLEEVLAGIAKAWGKSKTYMSERDFMDILADENLLEEFVVGLCTSAFAQLPSVYKANKIGADFVQDDINPYTEYGRAILGVDGGVDSLKALADKVAGKSDSKTAKSIGKLADKVTGEVATGKWLGKPIAELKNTNNATQIGKLYEAVTKANNLNNASANQADIVKSLERKGFSTEEAGNIAEVLVASYNGETLTHKQKKLLNSVKDNTDVQKTVRDIIFNDQSTMGQRSQSVRSFEDKIAAAEYSRLLEAAQLPQETAETTVDAVAAEVKNGAQATETAAMEAPAATIRESRTVEKQPEVAPANDQQITSKLTDQEFLQVAEESPVTEDGVTRQVSTGKVVAPKKIVSISGGKAMIETDNGTISADDIQFDSADTDLLWRSAIQFNGIDTSGANGVIRAYREGDSVTTYLQGAAQEFKNGYNDMPSGGKYADKLTSTQRTIIYELGQKAAGAAVAKQQASVQAAKGATVRKNGSVHYGYEGGAIENRQKTGKKLSEKQAVAVDFAQQLAGSRGITFYFYESYVDENGNRVYKNRNGEIVKAENGFYDSKDGSIHIDLNAGSYGRGSVLFTVAHELTHFIQDWSPKHYKQLCNILMKGYAAKGQSVDELVANQQAFAKEHGRELTWNEAYDEVIADSMESILADGKVMELMRDIEATDKTLGDKVKKFFRDICELLKKTIQAYSHVKPDSEEGRMVQGMQDIYDQLQQIFAEGLYEGSDNYRKAEKNTTDEGGVKYSPGYVNRSADGGYDFTKSFAEQLQDYLDGVFPQDETFIVGPTPNILLKIGLAKLPVTMDRKHVSYALEGTYPGLEERKLDHMMDKEDLANILAKISDPVAIIQDRQIWQKKPSGYSIDVLVDMEINGKKTLIPINVNQSAYANKTEYDSNKITTVHGDADTVQRLVNALNEHSEDNIAVFYINKEKASEFLQPTGHPISSTATGLDGFIHRVTDKGSNVKMRISSVTESRQFIQWFGNWKKHPDEASKIVNTDGTPKVMHHGSLAQFTIFDKKKAKSSGAYGSGFYFTDSQSHAATYGQQYSVYLNIRNPLQYGNGTVSRTQVRQFLEAVAENEDYSIENYGTYDVDSIVQNIIGKESKVDAFKAIQDISATAIGDMVEAVELFNKVNGTKYDGIITATETVAFYPEQIKSATDNIGTFDGGNPDIRFSARKGENDAAQAVLEQENAQLKENVSHLKELLKLQRTITNGTKFTKTSVEAAARMLKKNANARGDTAELSGLLNSFYEHIATNKELSWESVKENAQPVVDWLQDHVNIKPQRSEYAQDILSHLHGSRFYLDESQKAEAAHRYGSFDAYRKSLMGSVIIANDAKTSLDSLWQELSAMYPDIFDSEITAADQPLALSDAIYRLRNSDTSALEYEYNREFIAMDLLQQVYDSYWRVSALRTFADVKQAQINRLQGEHFQRMSKLREDNQTRIQQMKNEHRTRLEGVRKAYQDQAAKAQKEITERYQESRKKAMENREKTSVRHKIQRVVGELNDLLLHEDKKHHVPDSLKKAVADALSLVNMDNVGVEKRIAQINQKLDELERRKADTERTGNLDELRLVQMEIDEQISLKDRYTKMGGRLEKLATAYEEIKNSDDPDVANGYDPVISASLNELAESIGNTSLRDMSIDQLQDVYDMYKMVLTRVRDANKSLIDSIKETITNRASRVVGEVRRVGGEHKVRASALDPVRAFSWNNLKPVYAMERIGSATMTEAYNNVRKGEDTWAQDVVAARAYFIDKSKKYGYDSWDFEKKYHFKSVSEQEFDLTLEQIMSLYAYSKRDQAGDHLKLGGFVFDSNIETYKEKGSKLVKYKVNTADAHQISPEILAQITGTLTKEQTAFVDEMQDYLSTVMGAKGNEVTMKMYGVKLFKEKFYFPLKSARQFMFEQNEVAGEVKIKNSGFTNKTKPKANNPVILNNFMDVWANHVNDMSMYHAFVLPLEDFNRIFNYNSPKQEGKPPVSVKGTIQSAYSPAAVSYVKQLITDLNGGAMSDPRETFAKAMTAKFKKAKVFSSLSVVIQQPSAIGRAFAEISPKYFRPAKDGMSHDQLWAELKQYAPVAVIKEMGYFDTNMGKSTQDFIKAKEYTTFKEKAKAIFADSGYRDEKLSRLPALADEITWCSIWNAVKRETVAKHHDLSPRSEEFLKIAGERFIEVVTKTQVYDSVLARSANMRSKSGLMSMATSFMAEPTTAINMLGDAIRKAKRGNKSYAVKAFASVATSIVLNNALVALVYGMRDDDEDETFLEKYAQSFVSNMIDDLNPITYYPFLKDMWSLLQGYSVERSDMSLMSDLADATKALVQAYVSDGGDVAEAWWDLAGAVANIGGIPMQNISRDVNGAINFYSTLSQDVNGRATTLMSMGDALSSAVRDTLPVVGWFPGETKSDKLYDAIIDGDTAYANRLKSTYNSEDAYHNAVRKALRENDPRIREAAQAQIDGDPSERVRIAKLIIADGFAQDDVVAAINSQITNMTPSDDTTEPKKKGLYTAEDFAIEIANGDTASAKAARSDYIDIAKKNGKSQEEAEESFQSSAKSELGKLYIDGKISKEKLTKALQTYCDMEEDDIYWKIDEWNYTKKNGSSDDYGKYNEFFSAVQTGKNLKSVIQRYTDHGVSTDTLSSQISKHFKPQYIDMTTYEKVNIKGYILNAYEQLGIDREKGEEKIADWEFEDVHGYAYSDRGELYKDGELSADELRSILMDHGGMTYAEACYQIEAYDWEAEGYKNVTLAAVRDYNEHCAAYYVPKETYLYIKSFANKTKNDKDANGETIYYSAMRKVMAEINAQYDLSPAQKTAVARSLGWADKNIWKYKLW